MDKQVEFLVKLRDAGNLLADAANDYLDSMAPPGPKTKDSKPAIAILELNFNTLRFETMQGSKLGDYEVAYRQNNLPDKWSGAYNILRNSNATIKARYSGEDYQFSYWLYGEDKIYRQKLKPKN